MQHLCGSLIASVQHVNWTILLQVLLGYGLKRRLVQQFQDEERKEESQQGIFCSWGSQFSTDAALLQSNHVWKQASLCSSLATSESPHSYGDIKFCHCSRVHNTCKIKHPLTAKVKHRLGSHGPEVSLICSHLLSSPTCICRSYLYVYRR